MKKVWLGDLKVKVNKLKFSRFEGEKWRRVVHGG